MKSFKQFLKESQLTEGKQEYLKKYSSEPDVKTVVNQFWTIRQRLKTPENDIDWWIKKPYNELKQFVLNFDTSKNKTVRQQDKYVQEAEKWGAVMFGNFGPYEAWFVPTHEAAIQLGRFYKNISALWHISDYESIYFDKNYKEYEFVFLISDDKSLIEKQKLALQVNSDTFKLEGIWNILDKDIIDDLEQFEEDIISNVLLEFKKLNRSRNDNLTKAIINRNEEEIRKNANLIVNNILKNVTTINKNTISEKYKEYLTNIVIPNNVTSIGYYAFYRCESLISITIPNSVTSIGYSVFQGCESLTSITIPNSVTGIGERVFSNCTSLTSIIIPDSITSIGYGAFWGCESLTSITIPNSVTGIGKDAFHYCNSLKQVIFSSNSPLLNAIKNGEFEKWGLKLEQIFIKK